MPQGPIGLWAFCYIIREQSWSCVTPSRVQARALCFLSLFGVLWARPTHPVRLQAYMAKQAERWRGQPFPWSPSSRHGNKLYKQWSCVLSSWALILQLISYGSSCKICIRFCNNCVCHHIVGKFMHVIYEPILFRFYPIGTFPSAAETTHERRACAILSCSKKIRHFNASHSSQIGFKSKQPAKAKCQENLLSSHYWNDTLSVFHGIPTLVQIDVIYW